MIGPKQTTNEQMSNETEPTMGYESSAQSPEDKSKKLGCDKRKGKLLGDAGIVSSCKGFKV